MDKAVSICAMVIKGIASSCAVWFGCPKPPVAIEHLNCDESELKQVKYKIYTLDFKDMVKC